MDLKNRKNITIFVVLLTLISFPVRGQHKDAPTGIRNDFKVTLLSLGSGSSRMTYERAFTARNSGEFTLGLIGLGWDFMNKQRSKGHLIKLAYKWRLLPQGSSDSWVAGLYVKPELVWAQFQYGEGRTERGELRFERSVGYVEPKSTNQLALLAECGYQLVLDWFVFDVYAGLGPSVGTGNDNNYFHSFMLFPKDGFLAFTAGFRVGVGF